MFRQYGAHIPDVDGCADLKRDAIRIIGKPESDGLFELFVWHQLVGFQVDLLHGEAQPYRVLACVLFSGLNTDFQQVGTFERKDNHGVALSNVKGLTSNKQDGGNQIPDVGLGKGVGVGICLRIAQIRGELADLDFGGAVLIGGDDFFFGVRFGGLEVSGLQRDGINFRPVAVGVGIKFFRHALALRRGFDDKQSRFADFFRGEFEVKVSGLDDAFPAQ